VSPARLFLTINEVHVWCASLADPTDISFFQAQLSSDERARAQRFKFSKDRERFVVSHGILRQILALYVQVTARELELAATVNGKPELASLSQERTVRFNMSHSRDLALFAVTRAAEVGIDIEYNDETFAFDEVARRFFSIGENAALHSLPLPMRREGFFRCWTCKEALVKAKGTGLGSPLDEITITQTGDDTLVLTHTDPVWSLTELNPAPGYVAALAVEGHDRELKCWQWQLRSLASSS
jgi:4'-phosphopantetheinyl transferase